MSSNKNYLNIEKFYHACMSGDLDKINKFLENPKKFNINIHSENDKALMYAIKYNRIEIAEKLLEYDPETYMKTNIDFTLLYSISGDCIQLFITILEYYKNIQEKFSEKQIHNIQKQILKSLPNKIIAYIVDIDNKNKYEYDFVSIIFNLKSKNFNEFINTFFEFMETESILSSSMEVKVLNINKTLNLYIQHNLLPEKYLNNILLKMFKIIFIKYVNDYQFNMSYKLFESYCWLFESGWYKTSSTVFESKENLKLLNESYEYIFESLEKNFKKEKDSRYKYIMNTFCSYINENESNKKFKRFLNLFFLITRKFVLLKDTNTLQNEVLIYCYENKYRYFEKDHYFLKKYSEVLNNVYLNLRIYPKNFKVLGIKSNTYLNDILDIQYKHLVNYVNEIEKIFSRNKNIPNDVIKHYIIPCLHGFSLLEAKA